jgi:hypothetical protein
MHWKSFVLKLIINRYWCDESILILRQTRYIRMNKFDSQMFVARIWVVCRVLEIMRANVKFMTCPQQTCDKVKPKTNLRHQFFWILGFHMTSQKWQGGATLRQNTVIRVSRLFVLCIILVFVCVIFSLQYSIIKHHYIQRLTPRQIHCIKADFQSSHEAPRSSLRVLASNWN